jgi:BirA family transcriptional regulator, biotin operon repressor / biotin---[acetyl-CoA-carboxylase] ligase
LSDGAWSETVAVRQKGSTPRFGTPHHHFRAVGSTNTVARELAEVGAPNGTVVTTDDQVAGRGRQGRVWTAPAGSSLFYSAIVRPLGERHPLLPLAVPLAVCEAAEALRPGIEPKVKWPNDIHLDGRKTAGILIEARPQEEWAVVGVGLNLTIARDEFPAELRDRATSLFADARAVGNARDAYITNSAAGGVVDQARLALSAALERWVEGDSATILAEWRRRDTLLGREVSWEAGSGVAEGIDERGYLLVRLADGDRVALGAGDVHLTSF